jgi:predicted dehydrogenase
MDAATDIKLITLDPAHFHAALVQKEMLPGVAARAAVYAALGPDLLEHLRRIERFNARPDRPTNWELEVHCTPQPVERMCSERPGNAVVLAGRNRGKIGKIAASLGAGLNVLADKPWIIGAADLPALKAALDAAAGKGLIAYDLMTERYEITSILQKELVNDAAVFGEVLPGSDGEPGVFMESVHHILKTVAGAPSPRPAFFFNIREQGEGLADVGAHLVDLVPWTLFPEQPLRCPEDIEVSGATRWPTPMTLSQFQRVTGLPGFPDELSPYIGGNRLEYYCNTQVRYKIRGVHVRLDILWNYESPTGADLHHAVYRGTNSRIEVRQGEAENYRPEVYVAPNGPERRTAVIKALGDRVERLQTAWPGVGWEACGDALRLDIPDRYRVGHEAHFAQVLAQFLEYLRTPASMPAWELPNMIAKYYVTTTAAATRS